MENQKNSKGVIALLVVIIVILAVSCILFATGTISFNNNSTNNRDLRNGDTVDTTNNNTKELTEEEATTIVKNIFTNSTVQYLVDHISVTYCKTESTNVSEKELGLDYQWNGYHKCTDFNSYEQLTNYFKQYVTEDYFNSLLLKENYLKQKNTLANGTEMYNYYEKDGNLYAANTGKGGNMNKYKFLDTETVYKIDSFNNNQITATITAKWEDPNGSMYSESEKMTITNDNGNWKVSSYESSEL